MILPESSSVSSDSELQTPGSGPAPLWLLLALGAFIAAAIFVNPFRGMTLDDDWAYALTVRHLLEHGEYRLHDWAAANMPFQAYLGALFSMIGGFSFAALRLSTLLLSLVGLVSFYKLARESRLDGKAAAILTLVLASSPLFLRFSLNFMTDVPFLAMLLLSLWLYARAIRTESIVMMLVASLAGTAAVLTRQFGMAMIGGLVLFWLIDREYRRRPLFFLAGLILPGAASLWQLWWGTQNPTWGQSYAKLAQSLYMADFTALAGNVIWRPAAIIEYMGLFALPLVPALLVVIWRRMRGGDGGNRSPEMRPLRVISLLLVIYLLIALPIGYLLVDAPLLMPSLPWNFEILRRGGRPGMLLLTVVTLGGGMLLVAAAFASHAGGSRWRSMPPAMRLLTLTTVILLLMQLAFFKVGDEYLLVFLPFTLIAAGGWLRGSLARIALPIAAGALIVLALSALWTRGLLESEEASWRAASLPLRGDVTPKDIHGSWNFDCYYGAFDDYLHEIDYAPKKDLDEFFAWYKTRREASRYMVAASRPDTAWTVLDSVPYRSFLLDRHYVYLMERGR